ncbi:MAG: hypothetical protein PHN80_08845 [Hespellia sp.]|nr:hypothetical protein [Hespellia sp.]
MENELRMYELSFAQPSGSQGYYVVKPGVQILHQDTDRVTRYEFTAADGSQSRGYLEQPGERLEISKEQMQEGDNQLKIWMEGLEKPEGEVPEESDPEEDKSETGNENEIPDLTEGNDENPAEKTDENLTEESIKQWHLIEGTLQILHFPVDTSIPEPCKITYQQDEGLDIIYCANSLKLEITGKDTGAGVAGISYQLDGKQEVFQAGEKITVSIPEEYSGIVKAYCIDRAGNKGDVVSSKYIICDNKLPEIRISAKDGFAVWYQSNPTIDVQVNDAGQSSGLAYVKCFLNGKLVEKKSFDRASTEVVQQVKFKFQVTQDSVSGEKIPIQVEAVDKSGNSISKEDMLFLDKRAPVIEVTGAKDGVISSKEVTLSVKLTDENIPRNFEVTAQRVSPEGESSSVNVEKADSSEFEYRATLTEDGVYQIHLKGSDMAGNQTEKKMQMIVDRQNPIIRYVEQLNGTYVQQFRWNYEPDEMIHDFSSYTYHMELDGRLFRVNHREEQEGHHLLVVEATDAAGNSARAEAAFQVDHTAPEVVMDGVMNGKTYEKKVNLVISLANERDYVDSICINNQMQKIHNSSQVFQFPFEEEGVYDVEVKARDAAKNETVQHVQFQVRKKKGLAATVLNPVRKVLEKVAGLEDTTNETMKKAAVRTKRSWNVWMLLIIGSMVLAGAVVILRIYQRHLRKIGNTP